MDKDTMLQVDVEDVTIEELGDLAGASCAGTVGTSSTASTPVSSAACVGTLSSQ
jgi:hypothetical protein